MRVFKRKPTFLWVMLFYAFSSYAWIATYALWWKLANHHPRMLITSAAIWGVMPAVTALVFRHRLLATLAVAVGFWLILAGAIYGTLGGSNFLEETGFALLAPFEWPLYDKKDLHGNVNTQVLFLGTNLAYAIVALCFSLAARVRNHVEGSSAP